MCHGALESPDLWLASLQIGENMGFLRVWVFFPLQAAFLLKLLIQQLAFERKADQEVCVRLGRDGQMAGTCGRGREPRNSGGE